MISLEPIGRGIQVLEPDIATLDRTLPRAASPVYPGFPVPGRSQRISMNQLAKLRVRNNGVLFNVEV